MNELLAQGIAVMFIGMGTVLSFLCIMIAVMNVMSMVVRKLNQIFPEAVTQTAGAVKKVAATNEDENIAVAILAALLKK